MPECMNRVRTNLVRVVPSKLIHGETGLFACEDIEDGTVVAGFGAVRQWWEGAAHQALVNAGERKIV